MRAPAASIARCGASAANDEPLRPRERRRLQSRGTRCRRRGREPGWPGWSASGAPLPTPATICPAEQRRAAVAGESPRGERPRAAAASIGTRTRRGRARARVDDRDGARAAGAEPEHCRAGAARGERLPARRSSCRRRAALQRRDRPRAARLGGRCRRAAPSSRRRTPRRPASSAASARRVSLRLVERVVAVERDRERQQRQQREPDH